MDNETMTPQPKKRGRPPKSLNSQTKSVTTEEIVAKKSVEADSNSDAPKKKRGRPPKNAQSQTAEKKPTLTNEEKAETKERVDRGLKTPIGYYYEPIIKDTKIEYVEILQQLNDKFAGRLNQWQFSAVAELTKRIYELNVLLLETANETAQKFEKCTYVINLSSKWFVDDKRFEELVRIIEKMPQNVLFAFDAVSLATVGDFAESCINKLQNTYKRRIILDNVENRNAHLWLGCHPAYIRLDSRYFNPDDERYSLVVKFYKNYCDAARIKIIVKEINDDKVLRFFTLNGAESMQGLKISPPKKQLLTILRNYNII